MSNAPKPPKRSHSKQRRKVGTRPLYSGTPCATPTSNLDRQSSVNVNVVTQPSQECHDDDQIVASTLLALSSSPGRPPGASSATPFHSIVDSIVGRANQEEPALSSSGIDDSVIINHLYALGLRNKRILPAVGNAPSLLFGSQVSPAVKRPRLDHPSLDPSRRLMFSTIEEEAFHSSADTDTIPKGVLLLLVLQIFKGSMTTIASRARTLIALSLHCASYPFLGTLPNAQFRIHLSVYSLLPFL
jgi:hypothetical protein